MKNDGGILINMFNFSNIYIKKSLYVIEAGVQLWNAQETLYNNYGVILPCGSCYSIGAGGHITGGGYGLFSRKYGLTIESLYRIEIITVDCNKNVKISKVYKNSKCKKERNLF